MNDPHPGDTAANPLDTLVPAAPSAPLMARLRAARPPRQAPASAPARLPAQARPSLWLPLAACAAAAAVLATVAALKMDWRPAHLASATVNSSDQPATEESVPPAHASTTPDPVSSAPPVFLPVETASHLVSLHPVHTALRPDEAPRRLLRAIFIEDTTAVGADTDAALVLRRAREVYLPMHSPVY